MNDFEKAQYQRILSILAEHAAAARRAVDAQTALWLQTASALKASPGTSSQPTPAQAPSGAPLLLSTALSPADEALFGEITPSLSHNDPEKMLLSGMKEMLRPALAQGAAVPSIRANMGCGIYASLFPGVKPLLFDDDKMPWVKDHLARDTIRELREEDIRITEEFAAALSHMAYMAEMLKGAGVYIFPPDMQGPFDMAHIVYGDTIFYDMYDDPALVHHLLGLCCRAVEVGWAASLNVIPDSDRVIAHYNELILPRSLGGAKISEDTSTLLPPDQIDAFVIPYTQRALDITGGGYVHYCGRNDHLLARMLLMDKVRGVNFGNPEKHDMEAVLAQTARAGKLYYGAVPRAEAESLNGYFNRLIRAATLNGRCHMLLSYRASHGEAEKVLETWESAR